MIARTGRLLIILFMLSSCGSKDVQQLVIQVRSPAHAQEINEILLSRFNEFPASFFSTVNSRVEGRKLVFTFTGGAPPDKALEYLIQHAGNLVVVEDSGRKWITSRDITRVSTKKSEGDNYLQFSVSDTAAERIRSLSRQHIGKPIRVEFDNELLVTAVVRDVLSKRFEVSIEKPYEELLYMAAILRSGPLPDKVIILNNLSARP